MAIVETFWFIRNVSFWPNSNVKSVIFADCFFYILQCTRTKNNKLYPAARHCTDFAFSMSKHAVKETEKVVAFSLSFTVTYCPCPFA